MLHTRTVGRDLERLLRDGVRPARGDAYLLDRYLGERDETAFETLVERHGPMVLSLCRRYLRDSRDVEDAFQATFLILVRKGASLRDTSSLSSWLYGVAYRVALRSRSNLLKRRAREVQTDAILQAPARPTNPPDDALETLDAELNRLPEKYRAPLVLCYLEGRTHEQAAAELGWPVGTVRSRMARARALLETRLTRRGLDASACLAVFRPEFLLTSRVLPSLISASISWPATALAQGVLATMLLSQLKWIGAGATALALLAATAGISAWAVDAPGGPETKPNPRQELKTETKPEPSQALPDAQSSTLPATRAQVVNVEAHLADMDRKMDRLMERFERMMTTSTPRSPAEAHPRPSPTPPDANAPTPEPRADARGAEPPQALPLNIRPDDEPRNSSVALRDPTDGNLREIEARLWNALDRRVITKALRERGELSQLEYLAPLEEIRVLVARLRGIEDRLTGELEFARTIESPKVEAELQEQQAHLDFVRQTLQHTLGLAKQNAIPQAHAAKAQSDLRVASFALSVKKLEMSRCNLQERLLRTRLSQTQRILDWARSNFKELGNLDGPAFGQPAQEPPAAAPPSPPPSS